MTIKVLIFSKEVKWQGGVVNFIETLKKHLSNDVSAEQFLIGGRKNKGGSITKLFWPLFDAMRLVVVMLNRKYDVYHLNPSLNAQSLFRDGLFVVIVRLFTKKRILISFHGWENGAENTIKNSLILRTLFKWTFDKADCILVLARPFKNWLCKLGVSGEKIHLYTTMFDSDVLKNLERADDADSIYLLFLSRFVREKGIYELLDAFKKLNLEYKNIYLWKCFIFNIFFGKNQENFNFTLPCTGKNIFIIRKFTYYIFKGF